MWFFGGKKKEAENRMKKDAVSAIPALESPAAKAEVNGVVKGETSVFEFGSAATGDDGVTLAGYCPVSDEMEPCRWEILPSGGNEDPKFRIIF